MGWCFCSYVSLEFQDQWMFDPHSPLFGMSLALAASHSALCGAPTMQVAKAAVEASDEMLKLAYAPRRAQQQQQQPQLSPGDGCAVAAFERAAAATAGSAGSDDEERAMCDAMWEQLWDMLDQVRLLCCCCAGGGVLKQGKQ